MSNHRRKSYRSGSPSNLSRHHSNVSPSLENQGSRSHISISSDNQDTETIELLELRIENDQLKRNIQYLQGRLESATCVLVHSNYIHIIDKVIRDAYNTLVGDLSGTIDETKDEVRKMVHHISTNFTGRIPGVETVGIPLNPKRLNYKRVRYWNFDPWQAIRNRSKVKDSDSPILSLFFEDEFGELVSDEVKDEIRGDLYAYWTDMLNAKVIPGAYKSMGFERKEDYRKTMEGKFPWLRLCEGHWKVKQIWTNHISTWRKSNLPKEMTTKNKKTPGPDDTERTTPIEISSSEDDALSSPDDPKRKTPTETTPDEDHIPTGSKRMRKGEDNSDANSSKKHKGKGKEIATSGFHPAKPQTKRKNTAKIAQVSNYLPLSIEGLLKYLGGPIVFIFCCVHRTKKLTINPSAHIQIVPTVSETPPAQVRIQQGRLVAQIDLETK